MKIVLDTIIPKELVKVAIDGKIYPYVVCGVDVYRRPEIAVKDRVGIDQSRPFPFKIPLATGMRHESDMFFSNRHYRVIHLLDSENYDTQLTVADLRTRVIQLKAKGAGLLNGVILEQEDGDTAYVLTPLHNSELSQLMRLI